MSGLVGRVVWVVHVGGGDDLSVSGVFDSAEAAMAAHPIPDGRPRWGPPGAWCFDERSGTWHNGMAADNYAEAVPMTVEGMR